MKRKRPVQDDSFAYLWTGSDITQIPQRRVDLPTMETFPAEAFPESLSGSMEGRRFPRLDLRLPILYKVVGEESTVLPPSVQPFLLAESTNMSPIGLCLTLSERMRPGTALALSMHFVESRERFSALGRVVWARPAGEPGHFLTGLEFVVVEGDEVALDGHQKLLRLIQSLQSNP